MCDCISEIMSIYGLEDTKFTLLRHNENRTYRVDCKEQSFCLRLKKPVEGLDLEIFGEDQEILLQNELNLIYLLGEQTDIFVQIPIRTNSGDMVARLSDGTLASLLSWMEGVPFDTVKHTEQMLVSAGQTLAKLRCLVETNHKFSTFTRFSYDQKLLERLALKAERGGQYLPAEAIKSILKALDTVSSIMNEMDKNEGILIAHSDPGFGNMIWSNEKVGLIDWSLSGFAHSYMDLGGLMGATSDQEEQRLLLKGWESIRGNINRRYLDAYFSLSVLLFVCCQYTRSKEWSDWFPAALKRWQETIFDPLSSGSHIQCIL